MPVFAQEASPLRPSTAPWSKAVAVRGIFAFEERGAPGGALLTGNRLPGVALPGRGISAQRRQPRVLARGGIGHRRGGEVL